MEKLTKDKIISTLFACVLTVFLIVYIDWELLLEIIFNSNFFVVLIAICCYLLTYIIRALRFKILIGKEINYTPILKVVFIHGMWNRILPFKIGELTIPYYLGKVYPNLKGQALYYLIIFRFFDLIIILILLLLSINVLYIQNLNNALLILLTLFLLAVVIFFQKIILLLFKLLEKVTLSKFVFISNIRIKLSEENYSIPFKKFSITIGLTLLLWLAMYLYFFILIINITLEYSFLDVIFAASFANIASTIPISGLGSFGTLEVGWAFGFSKLGLEFNEGLTHGLFINMVAFIVAMTAGYISMLKYNNTK